MPSALESLTYKRGSMQVLDQLKVPQKKEYIDVPDATMAWTVVRSMQVRGAPLIAMVSALGLAVEVTKRPKGESAEAVKKWLREKTAYLRTSRPTAVNLFKAMDELEALIDSSASKAGATGDSVYEAYVVAAEKMLEDDVAANKAIGDHGADAILASMELSGKKDTKAKVLTVCNTGSLATAGWGTALGVIRSLNARGKLDMAYACETRPYNQGTRLTAFELVQDKIPGTLVCDSMAAALMQRKGIDAVVVGADRVAENGDTANKIGTYMLSILAKHHGVPFYVAAPTTTLDPKTASGADIPIEERPAEEMTSIKIDGVLHRIAPEGIACWNPAFDVAPAELIAGIVTEEGLITKGSDKKRFHVADFMNECSKRRKVA
eukprot:TRINITY_DN11428_c0_g1_i1.p1 TRINITY_DN11428_c0_g1~~TRINITY_DN11428_c0_g1_i1.p1  ORF type:complete len:378 (-),score=97.33 TRINITY_DN11428_c0_g1_i1:492-1625(-)